MGLGAARSVAAGDVLLRIPEAMSLEPLRTRSCESGGGNICRVERRVREAVLDGETSRLHAMLALIVLERRRQTPLSQTLHLLHTPETNIFVIDEEEFRLLSAGTSMERWRDLALEDCQRAHAWLSAELELEVTIKEVHSAYLLLHAHGQWADEGEDDLLALPSQVLLLAPLLLARPTPEFGDGVRLRHNEVEGVYEVVASRALRPGDEVHFVDRRLSDASALCFRGLWLTGRHRARLSLDVGQRDSKAQPILDKYGCGANPLRLYVTAQASLEPRFLGCMRMLALASNASKLIKAERVGWMSKWPNTTAASQRSEVAAAELAIASLQKLLTKLSAGSHEIRQKFGSDVVASRPTVKVREAETMVAVALLKAIKELPLLSGRGLDGSTPFDLDDHRREQRRR